MIQKYYPYAYADGVFAIDYRKLYADGFRALILDIDNTFVHHGDDSTPETDALIGYIQSIGFKTLFLSNNNEERVLRFLKNIDSPYICNADKPNPTSYYRALEMLGTDKSQTLCIGDQVFVDILGANRSGIPSILVKFIKLDSETKIGKKRYIEKAILFCCRCSRKYRNRLGDIILLKEEG